MIESVSFVLVVALCYTKTWLLAGNNPVASAKAAVMGLSEPLETAASVAL